MSLYAASINSGSNGNCYYVSNDNEAILVDAGISCREIEQRMKHLGLCIKKVKAIIVSHEHGDHVKGVPVLAHKYRIPVYITSTTLKNGRFYLDKLLAHTFNAMAPIAVGELLINAFPKFHDAVDPYSFTISHGDTTIGIFTDIGSPCEHVIRHFRQCNAAFLETNYDEHMLDTGNYPTYLKNRIRGGRGHLSNKQALALFLEYKHPFMSHLFLSHLSKNNNCPKLVQELFDSHAAGIKVIVASRHQQTDVYQIHGKVNNYPSSPRRAVSSQLQLDFPF